VSCPCGQGTSKATMKEEIKKKHRMERGDKEEFIVGRGGGTTDRQGNPIERKRRRKGRGEGEHSSSSTSKEAQGNRGKKKQENHDNFPDNFEEKGKQAKKRGEKIRKKYSDTYQDKEGEH